MRLLDAAGNRSSTGASPTVVLDPTPPGTPVLVSGPGATGNDELPTWNIAPAASDLPGTVLSCRLTRNGLTLTDWSACTDTHAADRSGIGYLLDTPPTPPLVTSPGSPANAATQAWTITASAGTTASCQLLRAGSPVGAPVSCSSGSVTFVLGAERSWTVELVVTDSAGNSTAPRTSHAVVLDTTPPDSSYVLEVRAVDAAGNASALTAAPSTSWTVLSQELRR